MAPLAARAAAAAAAASPASAPRVAAAAVAAAVVAPPAAMAAISAAAAAALLSRSASRRPVVRAALAAAAAAVAMATSGTGGFGAGAGGISRPGAGTAGGGGGGGDGLGGAIFVRQGGTLNVVDSQLPTGDIVTIGTGGAGAPPGAAGMATGKAIYLNQNNISFYNTAPVNSIIGDDIAGQGNLYKYGPGTLSLNGASSYLGATDVFGGTLLVNGSIVTPVFVGAAGRLGGTGLVGPTTVQGAIAPGNPANTIGTLSVNGGYVQSAGSSYQVNINALQQSDLVKVFGTANLQGGTIAVTAAPGAYTGGQRFVILNANAGVFGTYSNVTVSGPLGRPIFDFYQPTQVLLITALTQQEVKSTLNTFNRITTGGIVLNPLANPGFLPIYKDLLIQSVGQLEHSLDDLSGAIHGTLLSYSRYGSLQTGQMLFDQLNGTLERPEGCSGNEDPDRITPCGWNAWFKMRFGVGATANNFSGLAGDASGVNSAAAGFLTGMDRWLSESSRVGFYGGYTHTRLNGQNTDDSAGIDSFDLGLTGSQTLGPWYAMGFLGYGNNKYTVSRTQNFGFYYDTNSTNYYGNLFNAGIESGRAVWIGNLLLQPLISASARPTLRNQNFVESGDGITNLSGSGLDTQSFWTTTGIRFSYSATYDSLVLTTRGTSRWLCDLAGDNRGVLMQFAGGGAPFQVFGSRTGQNSVWSGLGFTLAYRDTARIFFDANILTSSHQTIGMGTTGFEIRW